MKANLPPELLKATSSPAVGLSTKQPSFVL